MKLEDLRRELQELAGPEAAPMGEEVERFACGLRRARRHRRGAMAAAALALVALVTVSVVRLVADDQGSHLRVTTRASQDDRPIAHLYLPSRILEPGEDARAFVVVENHTGREISFDGCGPVFQAVLSNRDSRQDAAWPFLCLVHYAVPEGRSVYEVPIHTRGCEFFAAPCAASFPAPPIPTGRYGLTLVAIPGFDVKLPPGRPVRVEHTDCAKIGASTVSLPDFTGLSPSRATAKARAAGFHVAGTGIPPDEPIGPDARVRGQQPSPHSEVRAGSCIAFMTLPE